MPSLLLLQIQFSTAKKTFSFRQVLWLLLSFWIPLSGFAQSSPAFRDSLRKLIATGKPDTAMVGRLNRLAATYPPAETDSVLIITEQARILAKKLGYDKGVGLALKTESRAYRVSGDYPAALQKGLASARIYDQAGERSLAASAEVELAQIYKDMTSDNQTTEYIDVGIRYGKTAYEKFRESNDTTGMVLSLNMCGILFRDKAKNSQRYYYDSAFTCYDLAFRLVDRSGKGEEYLGKLYNNISQIYAEHERDYKKALDYLFKAVAFNVEKNRVSSLSYNYGNISDNYVKLKDYKNGVKYARLMVAATLKEDAPARIQNAYKQMYVAFRADGRIDSALHYYILNDSINDILTNLSKTQQVMKLQLRYETEKKESEISRLAGEAESSKRSIILLAAVLILLTALAGTLTWLYQRIKGQKKQIDLQAQRLQAVMKELHHRVKNNLQIVSSLLSLQTYKLQDAEAILVFKESQQRVQAMSLIHQRLYTTDLLTAINMKEYVTDLAETLLTSYGFSRDGFDLQLEIEEEILDVEKALPIGLLINELVTNSLKYAFANTSRPCLSISLRKLKDELTLVVRDNGRGIDEEEWKKKGNSFGKQLIKVLGKQLRASQTVDGRNGTSFQIIIPNKAA
jgi:two-component sensor histidine kinase